LGILTAVGVIGESNNFFFITDIYQ
jgi:hypothetical protein